MEQFFPKTLRKLLDLQNYAARFHKVPTHKSDFKVLVTGFYIPELLGDLNAQTDRQTVYIMNSSIYWVLITIA